ncbi:MAG: hypothetical protein ACK5EA_12855 [Planctomycetaceae bacterium]
MLRLLCLCGLGLWLGLGAGLDREAAARPPNILFNFSDDITSQAISSYGD